LLIIRNAESKSLAELEKTLVDMGTRAREGRMAIEEFNGGTFTISNGGGYFCLIFCQLFINDF
jgi:2-oxoglutarate dehydrogenase E2 component (dihydrolipoamide succinyltransferase)